MKIRRATRSDARGILEVHRRAVHELAAEEYEKESLEAWSPPVDADRVEGFVEASFEGDEEAELFVAIEGESDDDRVLGFSAVVPSEEELRAVYVRPEAARRGLGTALLRQAEWAAAQNGAERLELDASRNAVPFYEEQGYDRVECVSHEVGDGVEIECVRMERELPGRDS
jgi:putative acetyltransferase